MAGRADLVEVTLHPDNSVTVSDNGSGIPTDVMKDQGLPAVTVVLTKLHAGGKFGGGGYKVSGGLHGVGVSVVNALSAWLHVEVKRDGKVFRQEFARGEPTTELKKVGPTKESGTTITFLPDLEIFDELEWSSEVLVQRLRETAFLTKGLRIMGLRKGDEVISADVIGVNEGDLLVVTENGYGKRTKLADYPRKGRGGLGVKTVQLTEARGHLVGARIVRDDYQVMLISNGGTVIKIPVNDVRRLGRSTQGVIVMRLREGELVSALAPVVEADEAPAPEDGSEPAAAPAGDTA